MFVGPHALFMFDTLMAREPRFKRPAPWLAASANGWQVRVPFVYKSKISDRITGCQEIGTVEKVRLDPVVWSAEINLSSKDVGVSIYIDREKHIARVAELREELAPTRRSGFSSRKEAARWVVNRSLQVGLLSHRRAKYLSPLQLLATCAEDEDAENV